MSAPVLSRHSVAPCLDNFITGFQSGKIGHLSEENELPQPASVGHTPSTAGTFRKKFRKNSGKTPETLSERFLEFPSRVRLGCPKPYNSRHLRLPERFQNCLPPSTAGDASFFRIDSGEGLSELVMGFPAVLGVSLNLLGVSFGLVYSYSIQSRSATESSPTPSRQDVHSLVVQRGRNNIFLPPLAQQSSKLFHCCLKGRPLIQAGTLLLQACHHFGLTHAHLSSNLQPSHVIALLIWHFLTNQCQDAAVVLPCLMWVISCVLAYPSQVNVRGP